MLLAVTGGLATGKTTFCRMLGGLHSFETFDADRCVHGLLAADQEVLTEVRREFGSEVFDRDGSVDRAKLREVVINAPEKRLILESILHPRVRQQWQEQANHCRETSRDFMADIPLLFETSAEQAFDTTVVVAASETTREARLQARGAHALNALAQAQLPLTEKCRRADRVIWNDGSEESLRRQASLLLLDLGLAPS